MGGKRETKLVCEFSVFSRAEQSRSIAEQKSIFFGFVAKAYSSPF